MAIYPLTQSQLSAATAADALAFLKSPALVARRFAEILSAQEFIGLSLLTGNYTIEGGAIGIPKNEQIRTERRAETVAPGAEYKLTPLSRAQYDLYMAAKRGIATEVTDEEVGRLQGQPIEDALLYLKTEMLFDANALAIAVINSKVTATIAAGGAWTSAKQIVKDVLRAKSAVRKLHLGFNLDTVVLTGDQYAEVMPEVLDLLPANDDSVVTGDFPNALGITWLSSDDGDFANPIMVDRRRLGGIAVETIPSPEYVKVDSVRGVEIASIRQPTADKTRVQARFPHVPVVANPLAGISITGTGL